MIVYLSQDNMYRLRLETNWCGDVKAFVAEEFVSCEDASQVESHWFCPKLETRNLFVATVYPDGVRHLEFNRQEEGREGYFYYPDLEELSKMLRIVNELAETDE